MDIVLWVLQGLLAVVFLVTGAMKAFLPPERLLANPQLGWITDTGIRRARQAGSAEIAGAFFLVVPGTTGVAPYLVPAAAAGLALLMGLAAFTVHRPRGESMTPNLVLGGLALLVAVGRLVQPL